MTNQEFSLSEKNKILLEHYLSSGAYETPNDVIADSLALLKQKEDYLRRAIQEGEESGIAENFNFDDFRKKMREKYRQ